MTASNHERAQRIISLSGADNLSQEQQTWLRHHLLECAACRDYAAAMEGVFRALRSAPLALDSSLVQATRMRLRARAFELRQQRERFWFVCFSCSGVGVSAAITTPLIWQAFEWIGSLAGISNSVWQVGFAFFSIAPALVVCAILMARGTHLTHNNAQWQWK